MRILLLAAAILAIAYGAFRFAEQYGGLDRPEETATATEEAAEDAEIATTEPPSFDIVRVDRSGQAVIAGRAAPGASVTLYSDGAPIAETVADARGEWVVVVETPLKEGAQELTLSMTTPDGLTIASEQTVVITAPERPDEKPLVVLGEPGGASRILQSPTDPDEDLGPLALEAIDYDEAGSVIFSGRATPGTTVRVIANGQLVGETVADEAGRWSLSPPTVLLPPGIYTLQIDMIEADGRVSAVIELPFERAAIEDLEFTDGSVIVQPGNSLWRIARRLYGRGVQYTVIYEANKSQIRDPDLIYPGQVLATPEAEVQ
ncbi:MAG: Ig-like domain-containing protein [Pseudomonadota bacterium]